MGFYCVNNIEFPVLVVLGHLKAIFIAPFSQIFLSLGRVFSYGNPRDDNQDENDRLSPSLVPVPVIFTVQSLKNQLPVMRYGCFVKRRSGASVANNHPACIVCMNCVETSDEVRELGSCNHVFHKDCLDAWIDHGNITCPLCKSKLLAPAQGNNSISGSDPWWRERLMYLFGDDNFDF